MSADQIAAVRGISDGQLAVLATIDLEVVRNARRDTLIRALYRTHYARTHGRAKGATERAATTRARHIARDLLAASTGEPTGHAGKDGLLARLVVLCGEKLPCANTIKKVCTEVQL